MSHFLLLNLMVSLIFTVLYLHKLVYLVVPLVKKEAPDTTPQRLNRFAVLIAARNEAAVITQLIDSIRQQDYPSHLIEIFVVSDNSTDNTAALARAAGAQVYERFNTTQKGKGYALNFLIQTLFNTYGQDRFDGYFVFDADNLLAPSYVHEMNHCFNQGYPVLTSLRNSKNFGDNWLSAGYAQWFLYESAFVNRSRMLLGTGAAISGTGFLMHKDVVVQHQGWDCYLLTEDIEFSVTCALNGHTIGYCHQAVFYDEQPTHWRQSWHQRMRWTKGFYQVFFRYGTRLARQAVTKRDFWAFDLFTKIFPAGAISSLMLVTNGLMVWVSPQPLVYLRLLGTVMLSSYVLQLLLMLFTTRSQWAQIHSSPWRKIGYIATFPLFVLSFIPISLAALFLPVQWKPITHTRARSIHDMLSSPS